MKGHSYYGPRGDIERAAEFEKKLLALLDEYGYWIGGAPSVDVGVWEVDTGTWVGVLEGTSRSQVARRAGAPEGEAAP